MKSGATWRRRTINLTSPSTAHPHSAPGTVSTSYICLARLAGLSWTLCSVQLVIFSTLRRCVTVMSQRLTRAQVLHEEILLKSLWLYDSKQARFGALGKHFRKPFCILPCYGHRVYVYIVGLDSRAVTRSDDHREDESSVFSLLRFTCFA